MKATKFLSAMMTMVIGFCALTSCGSDNDEPETPAAHSIAGTYHGDMTCSVMGDDSTFEDMTFTVTAVDDATAEISVSSFGNPPMLVPGFSVSGVKVNGTDGNYTIEPTEFEGDLSNGKKYSGTLQGAYSGNTISLQINLQYGAMPMPMICSFAAPKD